MWEKILPRISCLLTDFFLRKLHVKISSFCRRMIDLCLSIYFFISVLSRKGLRLVAKMIQAKVERKKEKGSKGVNTQLWKGHDF